jgi:ABC-type siderophore export system fused ATPase/permease subunit
MVKILTKMVKINVGNNRLTKVYKHIIIDKKELSLNRRNNRIKVNKELHNINKVRISVKEKSDNM